MGFIPLGKELRIKGFTILEIRFMPFDAASAKFSNHAQGDGIAIYK